METKRSTHGRRVGYVRLNALCRETRPQLEGVTLDIVFTDTIDRKKQFLSQLYAMTRYVREGDSLFIQRMDRLGRSPQDFLTLVRELTRNGVRVEFVTEQLAFPAGELSPVRNILLLIMAEFHEAAQSWVSEKRSEARQVSLLTHP